MSFITLTLVPESFTQGRWQINSLVSRYRQLGSFEALWVIERNPLGTGFHVHMLAFHERPINPGRLRERWGARETDIRPAVRSDAGYLLKGAYSILETHLRLNGGRLNHASRGFYLGLTQREAENEARRSREAVSGS